MFTNRALKMSSKEQDDNSSDKHGAFTPDQVVLFDVCLAPHPKATNVRVPPRQSTQYIVYDLSVQVAYRLHLALCFVLQRYRFRQMATSLLDVGFSFAGGWWLMIYSGDCKKGSTIALLSRILLVTS
jgi:hypothetical protein